MPIRSVINRVFGTSVARISVPFEFPSKDQDQKDVKETVNRSEITQLFLNELKRDHIEGANDQRPPEDGANPRFPARR